MDNFEHLLTAAPIVVELLKACPHLKIIVTSQAPLNISGELQYPVTPLLLPDLDRHLSPENLANYPSITLFVARAVAVNPNFALTEANAPSVAEICIQLDGLPLAIELAAANSKMLAPRELLDRLTHRLLRLNGGPIDLPARQRTLEAAICWSYELLDAWEQTLFLRLAVFRGGWNLEAAEAVVLEEDNHHQENRDVFSGLSSLVDKSLVQIAICNDAPPRFSMFETIREFALERLEESGEIEGVRERHAEFYLKLAEASEQALRGSQQQSWLNHLEEEHNNLRAALQWYFDCDNHETALKLAAGLWRFWWMHGHLSEGRQWLDKALDQAEATPTNCRARALNGAGVMARRQGDFDSARAYLEACLQIQRDLDDWVGTADALNSLGILAYAQTDYSQAEILLEESVSYRRKVGDQRGIAISLNNLGLVAQETNKLDQAEELFCQGLEVFQQLGDTRGISATRINLGFTMLDRGQAPLADKYFRQALPLLKGLRQPEDIIECLEGLGGTASLQRKPERAARLLAASAALRISIGLPMHLSNSIRYQRIVNDIEAQLSSSALEAEREIGGAMTLDQAMDFALQGVE
jgi:non-specific serine/threonine protein kinase